MKKTTLENSILFTHPQIASEWDYELNKDSSPASYTAGSHKRVFWRCSEGHSWKTEIRVRTSGHGCPQCSGLRVITGKTDLASRYPDIAEQWDYDNNGDYTPSSVSYGSELEVFWKCSLGHRWKAAIYSRTTGGNGCPICSSKKLLSGFNDLKTRYPEIAEQWHPTMNLPLTPSDVFPGSNENFVWLGSCGHLWEASPHDRISGKGCPICSGKKVVKEKSFAFLHPEIAKGWDYALNGSLNPFDFSEHSHILAHWRCGYGHSWLASISDRVAGKGCPVCAGKHILSGFNDLGTADPILAVEWDYENNIGLSPENVSANSHMAVWWVGSCGHHWTAAIDDRHRGSGCPICANQRHLEGYNDLETRYPELAEEWDYSANKPLTPKDILPYYQKDVFWVCRNCGKSWHASPKSRVLGSGCPFCNNTLKIKYKQGQAVKNTQRYFTDVGLKDSITFADCNDGFK